MSSAVSTVLFRPAFGDVCVREGDEVVRESDVVSVGIEIDVDDARLSERVFFLEFLKSEFFLAEAGNFIRTFVDLIHIRDSLFLVEA